MTTKSLKLSSQQVSELIQHYHNDYEASDHPTILGRISRKDIKITIYRSNTAVFQGENLDLYVRPYTLHFRAHAGSDEVGTGDTFGPVVVVACVVDETAYQKIKDYPILDSKALNDDVILKIGPDLFNVLPHSKLILNNTAYNRVQKTHNLNAIKAKLHNQAYVHLAKKTHLPSLCVIDQFAAEGLYFKYLEEETEIFPKLHFETKAESKYFAVACASIMARYLFLLQMEALDFAYDFSFPKGSSKEVDAALEAFIKKHSLAALNDVAKLHFKNVQKYVKPD